MNYHFDTKNNQFGIACLNSVNSEDIKKIILELKNRNIEVDKIIENDTELSDNGRNYAFKIILSKSTGFNSIVDLKKTTESILLDHKRKKSIGPNNIDELDNLRNLNVQLLDKVNSLEKNIILNNEKLELVFEKNKIEMESYFSKLISLITPNETQIENGINSLSEIERERIKLELDEKINDYEDTITELRNEIIDKGNIINSVRNEEFGIFANNKTEKKGILLFGDCKINENQINEIIASKLKPVFEPNIEIISSDYDDSKKLYKTLQIKFESGKFQYLIFGPTPHSIAGKELSKSITNEAHKNGIICYGGTKKPISKSDIENYTDQMFRNFYSQNNN